MSSKSESRYYQAVHRLLPKHLHKEKMHNPYRGGTADVWYSGNSDDLWVEYKFLAKPPVRSSYKVSKDLSELQLMWLHDRYKEGRNVVVIVGTPLGAKIYTSLSWETDEVSAEDFRNGLTKQEVANYITQRTMLNAQNSHDPSRRSKDNGINVSNSSN